MVKTLRSKEFYRISYAPQVTCKWQREKHIFTTKTAKQMIKGDIRTSEGTICEAHSPKTLNLNVIKTLGPNMWFTGNPGDRATCYTTQQEN